MSDTELLQEPKIRTSIIARATTKDGELFADKAPFITPDQDFDRYGCEDPRVTELEGVYYTFYTGSATILSQPKA